DRRPVACDLRSKRAVILNGVLVQQADVVLIPVAREQDPGIVGAFAIEKLAHARMTPLDLATGSPAVIRQVVTATEARRAIDQPPEILLGLANPRGGMIDV